MASLCVPTWTCSLCLPVPSLPFPDRFPLLPSPKTPMQSLAQGKSGYRSQSCHFAVFCVSFCTTSYALTWKQSFRTVKSLNLCHPSQKSLDKHDILGNCLLFIQGDQVPLTHCCGHLGNIFTPDWEAWHYIIKPPVPRVEKQEHRAEGMREEGPRDSVGDQLRVRWLLQALREIVQRWGGGARRVGSRTVVTERCYLWSCVKLNLILRQWLQKYRCHMNSLHIPRIIGNASISVWGNCTCVYRVVLKP